MSTKHNKAIIARPGTAERWDDICSVMGLQGCYGGCWCLCWLMKRSEMDRLGTPCRREAFQKLTKRQEPPGLLFYDVSKGDARMPFGRCALGPRSHFPVLQRSPVLRPVDTEPNWSMVCFYVTPPCRGQGFFRLMVEHGLSYARSNGAERLEAYPHDGHRDGMPAYMGHAPVFLSLGFTEIARRKPLRPILRYEW